MVGESGCGKSVTAKSLMGLIEKPGKVKPESKIIYQGKELTGYTEKSGIPSVERNARWFSRMHWYP